jgi:hypothetical protein
MRARVFAMHVCAGMREREMCVCVYVCACTHIRAHTFSFSCACVCVCEHVRARAFLLGFLGTSFILCCMSKTSLVFGCVTLDTGETIRVPVKRNKFVSVRVHMHSCWFFLTTVCVCWLWLLDRVYVSMWCAIAHYCS